jgi:hypothetical protein
MLIISYERLQVHQLKLKNKCLRDSDSTLWIRSRTRTFNMKGTQEARQPKRKSSGKKDNSHKM